MKHRQKKREDRKAEESEVNSSFEFFETREVGREVGLPPSGGGRREGGGEVRGVIEGRRSSEVVREEKEVLVEGEGEGGAARHRPPLEPTVRIENR